MPNSKLVYFNFVHLFFAPQEWDLPTPGGIFFNFFSHGDNFFLLELENRIFSVGGGFLIHLAVKTEAISCTPLPPGWAPAANLVPCHHCYCTVDNRKWVRFKRVRTIVRTPWIHPLWGSNSKQTLGCSQISLLVRLACLVVRIQTCHAIPHSMTTSLGTVLMLKCSLRQGSLADHSCALCILIVLFPQCQGYSTDLLILTQLLIPIILINCFFFLLLFLKSAKWLNVFFL